MIRSLWRHLFLKHAVTSEYPSFLQLVQFTAQQLLAFSLTLSDKKSVTFCASVNTTFPLWESCDSWITFVWPRFKEWVAGSRLCLKIFRCGNLDQCGGLPLHRSHSPFASENLKYVLVHKQVEWGLNNPNKEQPQITKRSLSPSHLGPLPHYPHPLQHQHCISTHTPHLNPHISISFRCSPSHNWSN